MPQGSEPRSLASLVSWEGCRGWGESTRWFGVAVECYIGECTAHPSRKSINQPTYPASEFPKLLVS